MKYDPIMCMMVPDSVKTKDGLDDPEKNAGYEMKKEGQYFKVYKNGKLIAMKSTEEEARREASRHRAANDSAVNEYEIHYTVSGKRDVMVGSGEGSTEAEAKADFLKYHKSENPKITSVKFYKKVSDEKALDKAITTCDKTELDPQDSRYIRKAIGSLKIASSLLGMINEGTVNKAKQNIANTISLLESID